MDRNDHIENDVEELGVASVETRGSQIFKPELGGYERLVPTISAD
jgi:hypothetical protein